MRQLYPAVVLAVTVCLGGCAATASRRPLTTNQDAPIPVREIRGTFVCARPGLLVIYSFLQGGNGLATIDTAFQQADTDSPRDISSESDKAVVRLTPTVSFSWQLTPPNLLTTELPWPDDTPTTHFLRVERASDGKFVLHEMETPNGPDLDIVFRFDHDLIFEN